MTRLVLVLGTVCLGLFIFACDNEYSVYEETKTTNTQEGYKAYIEQYPDGVNAPDAMHRLDGLDWEATVAAGTSAAYQTYITDHPEGTHITEATLEAPKAAWVETEAIGDRAAYEKFLEGFGNTAYSKKANEAIALIDFYPKHIEIGETKLEEVKAGKKWLVSAEVTNIGTVDVVEANFRVVWKNEEGAVVKRKEWLLVCQEQEGVDAPKELTAPIKPKKSRTFSFDFTRRDCSENWMADAEHIRVELVSLKVGE